MFFKIDLKVSYHQQKIKNEDIRKFAFKTKNRYLEFLMMSSSLTNALTIFMDLMNSIFNKYLDKFFDSFYR